MTQKPKQTTTQPIADEISSSVKLRINMSRNIVVLTVMIKGGIYYYNLFKTVNIHFKNVHVHVHIYQIASTFPDRETYTYRHTQSIVDTAVNKNIIL